MAHRGWRGVLPRHPHNSTCVRPSVRGIRVAWTIEWLQQKQKQKQKFQTTPNPCGSGLARDGSTLFLQIERGACIAGKPGSHSGNMPVADPAAKQAGRSAASGCSAFDLPALPGGREEVLWSGSTGMDAGRAAMGQGWPVAACPRSRAGAREPERSEGRTMGRGPFGSFWVLPKGTRRKVETIVPVRHKCRICTQRIG